MIGYVQHIPNWSEIKAMPTKVKSEGTYVHESLLRSHGILEEVKRMLERNDSHETILKVIEELSLPGMFKPRSAPETEEYRGAWVPDTEDDR
jgi:hypothetical protein